MSQVDRVPRKRTETRPRLLAAARRLLTERGLDRISVEAIAEHAGYTRGAFYSNFPSIDALLRALYDEHTDDLISHLRSSASEASRPDGFDSLEAAIALVVTALPFDVEWFRVRTGLAAQAARDPELAVQQLRRETAFRNALTPHLSDVVMAFDREMTVDPDTFTRALIAAHDGALANSFADTAENDIRVLVCTAVVLGLTRESPRPRLLR